MLRDVGVERRPIRGMRAIVDDYVALTKPRIILLLEITALGAMLMAARGWPGTWRGTTGWASNGTWRGWPR